MTRVVVVGAGVLGTMHAVLARRAGAEVIHLDRDPEAREATVRNFGMVWVSGRAPGEELSLALRARELWEDVTAPVPGVGFRANGSLTVAQLPEEVRVLEQVVAREDAKLRGVRLLEPDEARARNPALRGRFLAALHCELDALVEPGAAMPALRAHLSSCGSYRFLGGRTVVDLEEGAAVDHTGERHSGDVVVLCPGAAADGVAGALLAGAPVRRVRLQMMETEPLGEELPTSLADGDTLRYYPAYRVPAQAGLPPPPPVVAEHQVQLLVAQRLHGGLTIGDTHEHGEPFDFALDERPYHHLTDRLASILGRDLPPVRRRWAGVYSQALDEAICHREELLAGAWVVTGPGGRGMTLAPALAEQTLAGAGVIP